MAIANVVLNTKTYTLSSDQEGIITWRETSGGIPTGFSPLTLSLRAPNIAPTKGATVDGVYRIVSKLDMPIVATDDSVCACDGTILRSYSATLTIVEPPTGTSAERTDFGLRLKDWLANAQLQAAISALTRPS